jgi:putative flippase GtrA
MLRNLIQRNERVIRYLAVGAGVTLVYSLLTAGLFERHVVEDQTLASAIASVISIPISFLVHRRITYADAPYDRSHWNRFGIIALTNFVIATGSMKLSDLLGWPFWIALIVGWVLIPAANYTINAIWVFRTKEFLALDKPGASPAVSANKFGPAASRSRL